MPSIFLCTRESINISSAVQFLNHLHFRSLYEVIKKYEHEKDIVIFKGDGKVFSAGGDIKELSSPKSIEEVRVGEILSCITFDLIANYKKPFVALVDGLAMGGAAIYAISPKYRVATERTTFAMPETAIGYFNDAGASFFLSRLENNFGIYMGLTGARVRGFDMKKVGLATHYIESHKLNEVEKQLKSCKHKSEVENVLNKYASDPSSSVTELDSIMPKINECFGGVTVEEIYENLQRDGSDWAKSTLKTLNKMSPTSLKVAQRSISLGKNMTLRECLRLENRLVINYIIKSEMREGVRALLIDKDFKPNWDPKTIHEVTEKIASRFFEPSPYDEEIIFESKAQSKL